MKLTVNLLAAALLTLGVATLALASTGPDHKVFWCHYPPGQWTGNPQTSMVLILSIDRAAMGGHLGHSPLLEDSYGNIIPAEGESPDGFTCPADIDLNQY
jgi:hypothetical protein